MINSLQNELEQKIKSLQDIIVRSSGMETFNPKTTAPVSVYGTVSSILVCSDSICVLEIFSC